jgi:hypothetical protein
MEQETSEQRMDASSGANQQKTETRSFARFAGYAERTLQLENNDAKRMPQDSPPRHQLPLIGGTGLTNLRELMGQAGHVFHISSHAPPEGRRPIPQIA